MFDNELKYSRIRTTTRYQHVISDLSTTLLLSYQQYFRIKGSNIIITFYL